MSLSIEETCKKIDTLEDERKFDEIAEVLSKVTDESPEILWRRSRNLFDRANQLTDKKKQEELYRAGVEAADKAIQGDPNNFACHKWWAINQSSLGDFVSTKEKIGNSFKIREAANKAAELNPKDATTKHFLGRWCFAVSNVGWMERKLASAIFAAPPESSFQEALKFFQECDELDPSHTTNIFWLGETHFQLGNKAEAKKAYSRLVSMKEATSPAEVRLKNDAETKLKKL